MADIQGNPETNRRSVTVFVPGLTQHDRKQLQQLAGNQFAFPGLEFLLSRAHLISNNKQSPDHTLFSLFDVPVDNNADIPVGSLTRYLHKGDSAENMWCMRADPVYLQPNRDHLLLMGNSGLDISLQEAEQIVSDINHTYTDTSWQIQVLTPRQWVLQQDKPQRIRTRTLSAVVGKNIDEHLPAGEDQKEWHALLNELQMFLHNHPVNQQRQMQGLPVANSVWFWGTGVLPQVTGKNKKLFAQCWSEETVSLALARLTGVPRTDMPQDGGSWLQQAITPGRHMVVVEQLNNPDVINDPLLWWQSLAQFDEQWLMPLIEAVKNKLIDEVKFIDSSGSCYQLTRRLANRWWKFVKKV